MSEQTVHQDDPEPARSASRDVSEFLERFPRVDYLLRLLEQGRSAPNVQETGVDKNFKA